MPYFAYFAQRMRYYPVMNTPYPSAHRGFTVLELLIVVAVIGVIAAIALPNVVSAIQRARQSRTMTDMRTIGGALVLYEQDYVDYPVETSLVSAENLRPWLQPYMGDFRATDGWRRPYWYTSDGHKYTLVSYALGGKPDSPYTIGPTHRFEDDIVLSEGVFVQWPEGIQQ